MLKPVQGRTAKLGKSLEHRHYEKWLRELECFSLEERRLKEDLIAFYNCLQGGCNEVRVCVFSQERCGTMKENGLRPQERNCRLDNTKKISSSKELLSTGTILMESPPSR